MSQKQWYVIVMISIFWQMVSLMIVIVNIDKQSKWVTDYLNDGHLELCFFTVAKFTWLLLKFVWLNLPKDINIAPLSSNKIENTHMATTITTNKSKLQSNAWIRSITVCVMWISVKSTFPSNISRFWVINLDAKLSWYSRARILNS